MGVLGCCEKQFFIHNPKVPEVIKVPELPVFLFSREKKLEAYLWLSATV